MAAATIRAAFCDDDVSLLRQTIGFLDRYCREKNRHIIHAAFRSAWDLLAEIERGTRFDLLFLDILMPGQNGIDAAAEIRGYDSNVRDPHGFLFVSCW